MKRACSSSHERALAHQLRANERGRVWRLGALNGDYRLAHAYQPTAPNPSVSHHQTLVRMFEADPDLHRQYLASAGGANLALAALFQQDRASLKTLLDDLG